MKYILLPFFALLGYLAIVVYYFLGYLICAIWSFEINPRYRFDVGWDEAQEIKKELSLQSIKDLTWLLYIKYKTIVIIHNTKYYL
jgi:hypothetical protein